MIRKTLFILGVFATIVACNNQPTSYTLTGHIEGLSEGEMVYLYDNKERSDVDSVVSKEGNFSFTGIVEETSLHYIIVRMGEGDVRYKGFWLDNANISVNGDIADLSNAMVEGSEMQKQQNEYEANMVSLFAQMDSLYALYNPNNKELVEILEAKIDSLSEIESQEKINFIKTNPDYSFSAYLATRLVRNLTPEEGMKVYKSLSEEQQQSDYGVTTKEFLDLNKNLDVGDSYVDLALPNAEGETISLSSFKGKYVLVDFWASWCNPCRRESPFLREAYEKFNSKGFEIYAVSLDKDIDKWLIAVEEDEMTWPTVLAEGAFNSRSAMIYGVKYIPFNYLISPEGEIVEMHLRGEKLIEKLGELLGE